MIHAHPVRAFANRPAPPLAARSPLGWTGAGALAVLCSGVAVAALPRGAEVASDERIQWHALAIAPLSGGAASGLRMDATAAVEPIDFAPERLAVEVQPPQAAEQPVAAAPLRIRGRVGDGFYWSLRAAGASPQLAADYLAALATEIDVGDVGPSDSFDLVLERHGSDGKLLYAGLDRFASSDLQLLRWPATGANHWVDAANAEQPTTSSAGMGWPVSGRITSGFGWRYHPILHFARLHKGIDFGATWGSPIVAAADGQVARAGWAGGYGRQVRLAHAGGIVTSYSHMSQIVAAPGSVVHRGQLIGYVGSSGLSTGPHLHYEVLRHGTPVNPLSVRFSTTTMVDAGQANAIKARLKAVLSVGVKRG